MPMTGAGNVRSELLGRRSELLLLDAALDTLDGGGAMGVVQVAGAPGIGKSRLLAELAARAEARYHVVLAGRASEFERDLPFGVFVDAVDDYLASLDAARLAALTSRLPELTAAFPALAVPTGRGQPVLQAERYRIHRAVRTALEELAAPEPLVVMLDDVHWADPASVELLAHLVAHPPQGPVLIVVAFRPAQIPPQLGAALATAGREDASSRLELEALNRAEADVLVGLDVEDAFREHLFRQSGGNPFYLEQLLRAEPLELAASRPVDTTGGGVPPPVRSALAGELRALPDRCRLLLQGAAVAGDPFEDVLAAQGAGIDEAEALELLDVLAQAELVVPTTVPRRFRFRHPIVRRAVYEEGPPSWRVRAHARLASELAARGTPATSLAHHVAASASRGDEGAIAVLVEAAQAAAPRAPATAGHWYEAALRLLPDDSPGDNRHLDLMVARASAWAAAGRLQESDTAFSEALDHLPPGEPRRVGVVRSLAAVEVYLCRHERARSRLLTELRHLDDPCSLDTLRLKLELAFTGCHRAEFDEVLQLSEEVRLGARALGDPVLEALGASLAAQSYYALRRVAPAAARLDEAAAMFDALDDTQLAQRLDLAFWLGWAEAHMERYEDAVRHYERALDVSRAIGHGHFLVGIMAGQAWARLFQGRLGKSIEIAAAATDASRLTAHGLVSEATSIQAVAATYRGEEAAALRLAAEAFELARQVDQGILTAGLSVVLGFVLQEAGQHERARTEVLAACGGPELPRLGLPTLKCMGYEVLCRAELALNRLEAAEEWASRAGVEAAGTELPVMTGIGLRARAAVLMARGRAAEAADLALEAALGVADVAPLEAARSRWLAARALAQAGDRPAAIAALEEAEGELEACEAHGYVNQVRTELQRLGRRPTRRSTDDHGLAALTDREREIAELVSTGKTNREIAKRCYLSEKTVERHLTHIFTKLGVRSRTSVAIAVARDPNQRRHDPEQAQFP